MLTQEENLAGLAALNRELLARVEAIASPRRIVLDLDSTEVRVHGRQEQSAYNGHFESICYHPLLLFNREGDCLAAKLRPGNVHSADGWEELMLPAIERQQAQGKDVAFRGDAAFAKPELYEALEARNVKYAFRLPANDNLQRNMRGQRQSPPQIAEVVGDDTQPEPHLVGAEAMAAKPRHLDRLLAFLYPLLGRATLVVEAHRSGRSPACSSGW